jgi:hypothetical protein
MMRVALASMVLLVASVSAGVANDPLSLGVFEEWEAFALRQSTRTICYVYSKPLNTSVKREVKRDQPYVMVTHWPSRKVFGEVSMIAGYAFKKGSVATLEVDKKGFALSTSGDSAWAPQPEAEAEIVAALKTGTALRVRGQSAKGTATIDTYSLNGFTAAMDKIDQACK